MIQTIDHLVLIFTSLIVFLSFHESFLPTSIRRVSRNSVGVFPLRLCSGGVVWLKIEIVRLHHRRIFDFNFSNLKKDFKTQIWDPGISNFRSEEDKMELWKYFINPSRLVETQTASMMWKKMMEGFIPKEITYRSKESHIEFKDALDREFDEEEDGVICSLSSTNVNGSQHWLSPDASNGVVVWHLTKSIFGDFVKDAKTIRFKKPWKGKEDNVTMVEIYAWLIVVVTKRSMRDQIERKRKSKYFRMTLIRNLRYHVNVSESVSKASGFIMQCALWSFNKKMLLTHTIRIRRRSEIGEENSGFNDPLASKAYLRKASSNSLFYCVFFSLYGAYFCLCNNLVSNDLFIDFVISILAFLVNNDADYDY